MTKEHLIYKAARAASVTPQHTRSVINSALAIIKAEVQSGGEVTLRGFGTFKTKKRAQKPARNINTGATVIIPAHRVVVFKPARDFKINTKES